MCGHTRSDRIRNEDIRDEVEMVSMVDIGQDEGKGTEMI